MKSRAVTLKIQTVFISLAQLYAVVAQNRDYALGFPSAESLWYANPPFTYGSSWERSRIDRDALPDFIRGYIFCALWADLEDQTKTIDDITEEAVAEMVYDCHAFTEENGRMILYDDKYGPNDAGHDFWLSRNGHGTGFFDREIKYAQELQNAARLFGPKYVEVDDEGRVVAF